MKYLKRLEKTDELNKKYADTDSLTILKEMGEEFPSLALVSSFGTESAVLLHLVSQANVDTSVFFMDTGKIFSQTLDYKKTLEEQLGLRNIQVFHPAEEQLKKHDPSGDKHKSDTDLCCYIRKVEPLSRALKNTQAWISGRKRFQAFSRSSIPLFELDDMRIKINPLANWSPKELADYAKRHKLPIHPLLKDGYLSIGCIPCTSPVKEGDDPRSGRWRGQDKTECGIHGR
jgi:phosphoadenosine phosphosulfate reductase